MTPEERKELEARLKAADAATTEANNYATAIKCIVDEKTTGIQLNFVGARPVAYSNDQPSENRRHFSDVCWGKGGLVTEIKDAVLAILTRRHAEAVKKVAEA